MNINKRPRLDNHSSSSSSLQKIPKALLSRIVIFYLKGQDYISVARSCKFFINAYRIPIDNSLFYHTPLENRLVLTPEEVLPIKLVRRLHHFFDKASLSIAMKALINVTKGGLMDNTISPEEAIMLLENCVHKIDFSSNIDKAICKKFIAPLLNKACENTSTVNLVRLFSVFLGAPCSKANPKSSPQYREFYDFCNECIEYINIKYVNKEDGVQKNEAREKLLREITENYKQTVIENTRLIPVDLLNQFKNLLKEISKENALTTRAKILFALNLLVGNPLFEINDDLAHSLFHDSREEGGGSLFSWMCNCASEKSLTCEERELWHCLLITLYRKNLRLLYPNDDGYHVIDTLGSISDPSIPLYVLEAFRRASTCSENSAPESVVCSFESLLKLNESKWLKDVDLFYLLETIDKLLFSEKWNGDEVTGEQYVNCFDKIFSVVDWKTQPKFNRDKAVRLLMKCLWDLHQTKELNDIFAENADQIVRIMRTLVFDIGIDGDNALILKSQAIMVKTIEPLPAIAITGTEWKALLLRLAGMTPYFEKEVKQIVQRQNI